MKFDRLGDLTFELSTSLVKSLVLPDNFLKWLSKPLAGRLRDKSKPTSSQPRGVDMHDVQAATLLDGPMVLFGGAPVPDEAIVAFMHLAGGRNAKIAIIPIAAADHAAAAQTGLRLFTRFGMRNASLFELVTHERADSPEWAAKLATFDGVLFCGENAALGLEVIRFTESVNTLKEMMLSGKPIAGLMSGAALLGERVLVNVSGHDTLVEGLGFLPGLLVEANFTQEGLFGRVSGLLSTESASHLMGVGIEAGTAIVIRNGEAKVLGDGSATFLDGRDLAHDDPSINGMKVHVLMDGYEMHLRTRKPVQFVKEPPQAVNER
jgi:cyanophycinase